ncbi:helix-turn-helix domain-containing protein, partial [bacterium]|nr:helix-turn-helix domain-containing protein [bacterium]
MSIKVGRMIKMLRKEKGVSLRELAKEVGVSFVNISYIENGKIETSKEVLRKIAEKLGYNFDKLLSLTSSIDDDIIEIINNKPDLIPTFLRSA